MTVICILGLVPGIPLPFMPVPIVLQNIGIFLAGVILGRKYGALSVIIFLLLAPQVCHYYQVDAVE